MEFAIRLVVAILPVFYRGLLPLKPIVPSTHDENHTNGSHCGRNDHDQNTTAQSLNHPCPGGGHLSITKRTVLGKSRYRQQQHKQSCQCNAHESDRVPKLHISFPRRALPSIKTMNSWTRALPTIRGSCPSTHLASPTARRR